MKRDGIRPRLGVVGRSRTDVIVSNIVEVDEREKERRGQIVAGIREHGLIAKTS